MPDPEVIPEEAVELPEEAVELPESALAPVSQRLMSAASGAVIRTPENQNITVRPNVQALADALLRATGADSFGTYLNHSPPEGPTQAIDIFNPDSSAGYALQDRICAFAIANARRYGVRYIIRREHIWNIERAAEGWRRQKHYGDRTRDHYDHTHVTCYRTGSDIEPDPIPTPKPTPIPTPPEEEDVKPFVITDVESGKSYLVRSERVDWITDGLSYDGLVAEFGKATKVSTNFVQSMIGKRRTSP